MDETVGGTLLVCWTVGEDDMSTDYYEAFRWEHPQQELEQVAAAHARYTQLVQAQAHVVSIARVQRSTDYT